MLLQLLLLLAASQHHWRIVIHLHHKLHREVEHIAMHLTSLLLLLATLLLLLLLPLA
jgi:hypothetical protein